MSGRSLGAPQYVGARLALAMLTRLCYMSGRSLDTPQYVGARLALALLTSPAFSVDPQ